MKKSISSFSYCTELSFLPRRSNLLPTVLIKIELHSSHGDLHLEQLLGVFGVRFLLDS